MWIVLHERDVITRQIHCCWLVSWYKNNPKLKNDRLWYPSGNSPNVMSKFWAYFLCIVLYPVSQVSSNEGRHYRCNISSHWLRPCSHWCLNAIDVIWDSREKTAPDNPLILCGQPTGCPDWSAKCRRLVVRSHDCWWIVDGLITFYHVKLWWLIRYPLKCTSWFWNFKWNTYNLWDLWTESLKQRWYGKWSYMCGNEAVFWMTLSLL